MLKGGVGHNEFTIYYLIFLENVLTLNDPGSALWMTREEYITFGYQTIAVNDNILDEDG